jgi:hypothetical protein
MGMGSGVGFSFGPCSRRRFGVLEWSGVNCGGVFFLVCGGSWPVRNECWVVEGFYSF